MAIPPFPSQDLAKLVLGYLAEEQLMTAYDEFLLASPYLDVLRNEYDRIFMTSLKSILAEYRAVKIYVETCKPFLLRKKLFQCTNLLEIVKFLVNYVDINRLQAQETSTDKICSKPSYSRSSSCDICGLANCTCNEKCYKSVLNPTSHIEASTLENSVETTSLSDLPGNSVPEKKLSKDSSIGSIVSQTISNIQVIDSTIKSTSILDPIKELTRKHDGTNTVSQLPQDNTILSVNQDLTTKSDESKQKIEEFNNIYNLVCNNNSSRIPKSNLSIQDAAHKTICSAGTFQDFASGVIGSSDNHNAIIPDSSTTENHITQSTENKEKNIQINQISSIRGQSTPQFLLKVGTTNNQYVASNKNLQELSTCNQEQPVKILPKPDDQKIKIISDVKVDNLRGSNLKVQSQPISTSNSMLQMQTIVINGTPAYKPTMQQGTNYMYTKDEIMAMPTIIIVPASSSKKTSATSNQIATVQCANSETITTPSTTTKTSTAPVFDPLVIDVSSNNPPPLLNSLSSTEPILKEVSKVETNRDIFQIVDLTHNSVPKDTNLISNKTSTPQILPPIRKSSSTPRRTSHVRVLDFTTPRRILHETINEQDGNKVIEELTGKNTDLAESSQASKDKEIPQKTDTGSKVIKPSTKENSIKIKKNNWDAELRALAVKNDDGMEDVTPKPKPKSKTISKNVSKFEYDSENVKSNKGIDSDKKNKATPKVKKKKKIKKLVDLERVKEDDKPTIIDLTSCTKLPTANVITEIDWNNRSKENLDQIDQAKLNYSDERVDTPETERLSLQNVIGTKLNISDLLETPYKQVLYDIQMETPKFLGHDLPDEPISDIKIMNIPTPRFLNTPKPIQATPSSYSSRPTDYSSGGSYYKPDDQDYIPSSDILACAVTVVEKPLKVIETPSVTKSELKEKSQRSSRPQRKCTRNVSYRSPHLIKTKEDDNVDKTSISSEISNTSSRDKKASNSIESKSRSKIKKDEKPKRDHRKKVNILRKSPIKKVTPKKYIRIKPFKTTPIKVSPIKGRKKSSDLLHTLSARSQSKKRTTSKEKNATETPIISAAPTKSRRKSSTPRKLHCTKSFPSDSPEPNSSHTAKNQENIADNTTERCQDSDSEQQPLRWSDDGSQDDKIKETATEIDNDEIDKIKEYIESSVADKELANDNIEGSLHTDLVRRGFDVVTARIIERDLLDTTPIKDTVVQPTNELENTNKADVHNGSDKIESDGSFSNNLQIVQNEDELEEEEIELSSHDCNEDTKNYTTLEFDESKFVEKDIPKLKDKFSMEVCIDDGVSIRLRATQFESFFENIDDVIKDYNPKETEAAVNSISNIDKLYTPMKDPRAQCYELFDSTLTSIDTPLKSETIYETTVTEIVLEVESIEGKEKGETKKRKRVQSGNSDESLNKKTKSDTQYLLNTTNIQNIDIESVLSKLHGP